MKRSNGNNEEMDVNKQEEEKDISDSKIKQNGELEEEFTITENGENEEEIKIDNKEGSDTKDSKGSEKDELTTSESDENEESEFYKKLPVNPEMINKFSTLIRLTKKRRGSNRGCKTLTMDMVNEIRVRKENSLNGKIENIEDNKNNDDEEDKNSPMSTKSVSQIISKTKPKMMLDRSNTSFDSKNLMVSQPKLIDPKKENIKTLKKVKWNPLLKEHNKKHSNDIIMPSDNYNLELGMGEIKITEDLEDFNPPYQLEDLHLYKPIYATQFYKKDHLLYLVEDFGNPTNNVVAAVKCNPMNKFYLCFFITGKGFFIDHIPLSIIFPKRSQSPLQESEVLSYKSKAPLKKVKDILESMIIKILCDPFSKFKYHLPSNFNLLSKEIYKFEKDNTLQNIKIGLIYTKKGDM